MVNDEQGNLPHQRPDRRLAIENGPKRKKNQRKKA